VTQLRLITADQAASEYNLPSARTLRTMRLKGLPAVRIGKAYLFDASDVERHILNAKVSSCHAPIEGPRSSGSASGNASTSPGSNPASSVAVRLARQTADKLKKRLPTSCASVGGQSGQTAPVIPIK